MNAINVGIFGLGRGDAIMRNIMACGGNIAAICDRNTELLEARAKSLPAACAAYTSFDELIEHKGLDAIVLANCFHEHAPYAIRCLERGIHVLSECTSNGTMAEGVALMRAAKKSKAIYMLAENYPYLQFNQEMHRVYQGGSLGKVLFAEGEYNHPFNQNDGGTIKSLRPYPTHWRNYLPRSYYLTHSLAPLMYITGVFPKRVTAFGVYEPFENDGYKYISGQVADRAAVISILNDDGSVFRVTGCAAFGAHGNAYRICGTKGQMENIRGGGGKVMLRYNDWEKPEGMDAVNCYMPEWSEDKRALIEKAGHGGGDYFVAYEFLNCIREGKPHRFDVHFATTIASVAILAHRSLSNGGRPYDIPDFRNEDDCIKYENDYDTPFYASDGSSAPTIPCCSNPDYKPDAEKYKNYLGLFE